MLPRLPGRIPYKDFRKLAKEFESIHLDKCVLCPLTPVTLRYDGQGVISSLDGAVLYTGWQMAAYRIGELERLTIYGGASVGVHYARSLAIEWNHDR